VRWIGHDGGVERRLILWDIDGTLLTTGHAGRAALETGASIAANRTRLPHVVMSGKTDPQIVDEIFAAMGIPSDDRARLVPVALDEAERLLADSVDWIKKEGHVHPGVRAALDSLASIDGVRQTLVTGNIAPNALCKVRAFDLDGYFDIEVSANGSDHANRDLLVPICRRKVREVRDENYEDTEVWVIGDTPNDLRCARAGGARCLLVGTGTDGFESISGLGADEAFVDLSDTQRVLAALVGR
jgi:phosphoglycolate phosphatase